MASEGAKGEEEGGGEFGPAMYVRANPPKNRRLLDLPF
jgi:hypothetical protein